MALMVSPLATTSETKTTLWLRSFSAKRRSSQSTSPTPRVRVWTSWMMGSSM